MKKMNTYLKDTFSTKLRFVFMALMAMALVTACGDDDSSDGEGEGEGEGEGTDVADPVAAFTHEAGDEAADYFTVQFTDASTGGAAASWAWDFDDDGATSTEQSPSHDFPTESGTYDVSLTVTNSADVTDETTVTVTITKINTAAFTFASAGSGTNDDVFEVTFTDATTDIVVSSVYWEFGEDTNDDDEDDTSTDASPTYDFPQRTDDFEVTLNAIDANDDTLSVTQTVSLEYIITASDEVGSSFAGFISGDFDLHDAYAANCDKDEQDFKDARDLNNQYWSKPAWWADESEIIFSSNGGMSTDGVKLDVAHPDCGTTNSVCVKFDKPERSAYQAVYVAQSTDYTISFDWAEEAKDADGDVKVNVYVVDYFATTSADIKEDALGTYAVADNDTDNDKGEFFTQTIEVNSGSSNVLVLYIEATDLCSGDDEVWIDNISIEETPSVL